MNDLTLPIKPTSNAINKPQATEDVKVLAVNPNLLPTTTTKVRPSSTEPKSAKRLVSTKDLSHKDWLAVRNQGIGGSDAAAACGLNPYMSMLELWLIKTGRMNPDLSDGLMENAYSPLYWGKQLEPLIAKFYTAKTGNKVRRVNAVLQTLTLTNPLCLPIWTMRLISQKLVYLRLRPQANTELSYGKMAYPCMLLAKCNTS